MVPSGEEGGRLLAWMSMVGRGVVGKGVVGRDVVGRGVAMESVAAKAELLCYL